jgi:hypothetical protein
MEKIPADSLQKWWRKIAINSLDLDETASHPPGGNGRMIIALNANPSGLSGA